ncbi:MAG: YraN family protein [Blastocatellia bacterium]
MSASMTNAQLGALGEQLALRYLEAHGYRLAVTNYTTPVGRSLTGRVVTGEIDIIAYDESGAEATLCFIEVKTRSTADIALPEAAVDLRKQRQIIRAARIYRRILQLNHEPFRYDVVTVLMQGTGPPRISLLRGQFSEAVFQRGHWMQREP